MSFLDKIVGAMSVKDDYDDDYEDDYLDEEEEEEEEEEEPAPRKRFASRVSSQNTRNNITPLHKAKVKKDPSGREIYMFQPNSNKDSINDIMDALMEDKTVVLNLEGASEAYSQKVIDTVSGCIYALEGNFLTVSNYIYIFSPKSVSLNRDGSQEAMSVDPFSLPAASGMVGRR